MTTTTLAAPPASDVPADDGARRRLLLRRWLDVATWLLLVVVAAPPVVSSGRNLYELGHRQLALPGHWALLVPLSVDAAALLCVFLTLRAVHAGQSAGMARGLVIAFAGMSAWLGYQEAALIGTQAARVFYPVMPVAAALLLDMVIRHRRRDALERLGALEPALPRFRVLRWFVAFNETRRAWAAGVRHGITDPAACLSLVREVDTVRGLAAVDAVHYAFRAVGVADEFAARAWLAERGAHVDQAALDAVTAEQPRPTWDVDVDIPRVSHSIPSTTAHEIPVSHSEVYPQVTEDRTVSTPDVAEDRTGGTPEDYDPPLRTLPKARAIREVLDRHPQADGPEVVAILARHGVDVATKDVANVRYRMRQQKKRGALEVVQLRKTGPEAS